MNCALTREEIRVILEGHFRMPVEDFVIVTTKPSAMGNCVRAAVTKPEATIGKYGKVKELRNLFAELKKPINLPDARWAIENWPRFIEFIDTYNRLPERGWAQSNPPGRLL